MAKKEAVKETKELEKVQTMAMDRPDFLPMGDKTGTEDIGRDDMALPRLGLAQKMSYELDKNHAKYIPDLEQGELFNTLTGQIIGPGPVEFAVIRRFPPRHIEFYPLEQGGGIKDMNVPANDPRTQFQNGPDGERLAPVATEFHDYVVAILPINMANPMDNVVALSFKSTGIPTAKRLNGLLKARNAPIYAGKYTLGTASMTKKGNTFYVYTVANSKEEDGATSKPGWVNEEHFNALKALFEMFKDKEVNIDRGTAEPAEEELAADM